MRYSSKNRVAGANIDIIFGSLKLNFVKLIVILHNVLQFQDNTVLWFGLFVFESKCGEANIWHTNVRETKLANLVKSKSTSAPKSKIGSVLTHEKLHDILKQSLN